MYWRGLPLPSAGELPDPGTKPGSPALRADSLPTESQGKPELLGDFPGGPVVKTLPVNARSMGLMPYQGANLPYTSQPKKEKKKT